MDAAEEAPRAIPEQESNDQLKKLAESATSAARSMWLAALGVPSAALESGGELFHYLVERGEKTESQGKEHLKSVSESAGRAAKSVSSTVNETIRDFGEKARSAAGKGEEAFDQKVADTLKAMGVPTKEDLQSLRQRVDEIAEKVEKLASRS
jgi:poly(hydroxyalkanoate) granule-associated protein